MKLKKTFKIELPSNSHLDAIGFPRWYMLQVFFHSMIMESFLSLQGYVQVRSNNIMLLIQDMINLLASRIQVEWNFFYFCCVVFSAIKIACSEVPVCFIDRFHEKNSIHFDYKGYLQMENEIVQHCVVLSLHASVQLKAFCRTDGNFCSLS